MDVAKLCRDYGIAKVTRCFAGAPHVESSLAGMSQINRRRWRPSTTAPGLCCPKVIEDAVKAARLYKAVAPAIPVKDTVKLAESGVCHGNARQADYNGRADSQVFDPDLIKGALTRPAERAGGY